MMIRTLVTTLALAAGVAGCDSGNPSAPTAPSTVQQPTPTPPSTFPPGVFSPYTLSGVAFESTTTGQIPLEGVDVYCELCGAETHSWAVTDSNGIYSFTGVWTTPGVSTPVSFSKDGYTDPPGIQHYAGPGWRSVMIAGDTRFDVQLVKR
jgi:hypothetical protein